MTDVTIAALVVACCACCAGCEAQPHLNVKLRPPPGVTLEPAKLHVEARLDPEPDWRPANVIATRVAADGVDLEIGLPIGPAWSVRVRAWYDANGNGARDPGEPAGEMASSFAAHDSGGCNGRDANRAPDVVLAFGSGAP